MFCEILCNRDLFNLFSIHFCVHPLYICSKRAYNNNTRDNLAERDSVKVIYLKYNNRDEDPSFITLHHVNIILQKYCLRIGLLLNMERCCHLLFAYVVLTLQALIYPIPRRSTDVHAFQNTLLLLQNRKFSASLLIV